MIVWLIQGLDYGYTWGFGLIVFLAAFGVAASRLEARIEA